MSSASEPLAPTSEVVATLAVEGFRFAINAETSGDDLDEQGQLEDGAIARVFDDATVAYAVHRLGPSWPKYLDAGGLAVVARELHIVRERPVAPAAQYVVGTRVAAHRGRACVIEHRLVATDDGRPVAHGELVQLLVESRRVMDWPGWYWDLVATAEEHPIPKEPRAARAPWGPPS